MSTVNTDYLEKQFRQLQDAGTNGLNALRSASYSQFEKSGVPGLKNEEWKYTRISELFKKEYTQIAEVDNVFVLQSELEEMRLPGNEKANEIILINGKYIPELSTIRSSQKDVIVMTIEHALKSQYNEIVNLHLNKSSEYIQDGMHALNTSFIHEGVFIMVQQNAVLTHPFYFYHLLDAQHNHILAQPRSLLFADAGCKLQVAESYKTIGKMDSFTNEVMEIVVADDATVEYYKIQNDGANASQVGTTHIRQTGKCNVHTVTLSLDGGMVRNNIDIVMEAAGNEAHMYGLYLVKGKTHIDNHTLVDNKNPNCFSNELYKGILDGESTGVFSGKIFVRPDAQKTNAYQSNKNILISETASVNTKPQLEIFADDVKCSHGCTIGQLDEEALFYLRTRGIGAEKAQSLLLKAFAADVISHIKPDGLRQYAEALIDQRLDVNEIKN